MGEAAKRGVRAALALRRLRAVPPEVARQLFTATVASKVDYAASVWCSPNRRNVVARWVAKPLSMIQRIAGQATVGCYKTVALRIAEAEVGIDPVLMRLRKRVLKHWVKCHTLPRSHPFWTCRNAVADQRRDHPSPIKLLELLCPEPTSNTEVIGPIEGEGPLFRSRGPHIVPEPLYGLNVERQPNQARIWIFTHSVERSGKVGSGLVMFVHNHTIMICSGLAGNAECTNIHLSSLMAIHDSMSCLEEILPQIQMEPSKI